MLVGGALYFNKRTAAAVFCEKCHSWVLNRLTHHIYGHLDNCELFLCPKCEMVGGVRRAQTGRARNRTAGPPLS